jgi:hypothetical protein
MSYSIPPIGTVLPAKENVNPTIPNPGPTHDANQFYEWMQAEEQNRAFKQNLLEITDYTNTFQNWLTGTYPFQPDPDLAPPQPPAACVVLVAPAEAAPVDFQVVQSGTTVTVPFTPNDGSGPDYSTGPYVPGCAVPFYAKIAPPANPADNKIAEKHGRHKK